MSILRAILNSFGFFWEAFNNMGLKFWTFVVFFCALAYQGLSLISDLTIRAFQVLIDFMSVGSGQQAPCGGALQTYFALANTFYPLDETLQYMAALILYVWIPLGVYRLFKSWIPAGFGGGS